MSSEIRALFDIDGVIVDSVSLNWAAKNSVFREYGFEVSEEDISSYLGRPLKQQISEVAEDNGVVIPFEDFEQKLKAVLPEYMQKLTAKPGVVSLLQALESSSSPIIAATSLPRELMHSKLSISGVDKYFKGHVTSDDVVRPKPDPEVFTKAAAVASLPVDQCVVFEDAPAGVAAGKAGGFKVIAVNTSHTSKEDLGDADIVVDSLEEVGLDVIKKLLSS